MAVPTDEHRRAFFRHFYQQLTDKHRPGHFPAGAFSINIELLQEIAYYTTNVLLEKTRSDIHLAECRQIFEEAFLILHMEREIRSIRIFSRMFPAACGFLQHQEFLYQAIARIFQDL